jgi:GT2 family glycosyltransferase
MIYLIIVCYHSEQWLEKCLQTIFTGNTDLKIKCLLIDNAQMEQTFVDGLLAKFPKVAHHKSRQNLFYGGGNNLGMQKALEVDAQYIGLINPDTWFAENWLPDLIRCFEHHSDFGILAPLQYDYEKPKELADWTKDILSAHNLNIRTAGPLELPYVEGSCLFLRAEVIRSVGIFNPLFEMYYEEIDLCRRAKIAGYRVGVCTDSRYYHYSSRNVTGKALRKRNLRISRSQFIFILTNPELDWRNNIRNGLRWTAIKLAKTLLDTNFPSLKFMTGIFSLLVNEHHQLKSKWSKDRDNLLTTTIAYGK